ncbi:hypothetical protein IE81DRAFT_165690 [Ceraceosorus guamensis]|uniref:Uncharacterized protein n=1 Tax=Ceraceosorus guamensis TaxID=1522189 RepID=A0A316W6Y7_9BASI|nr:hypothetical protein IE81DRAFT_165690 [Ceraceosorus guamensis]PWN45680.1 hypothetical protein IE81DRAFT_165690 [Ceraceosorus guamensis]
MPTPFPDLLSHHLLRPLDRIRSSSLSLGAHCSCPTHPVSSSHPYPLSRRSTKPITSTDVAACSNSYHDRPSHDTLSTLHKRSIPPTTFMHCKSAISTQIQVFYAQTGSTVRQPDRARSELPMVQPNGPLWLLDAKHFFDNVYSIHPLSRRSATAGTAASASSNTTLSGASTSSLAILAVGLGALIVALGLGGYVLIQYRKRRLARGTTKSKLNVSAPTLKFAPRHAVANGVDLKDISENQRRVIGTRGVRPMAVVEPLGPSVHGPDSSRWDLGGYSTSTSSGGSSGPMPASSSAGTRRRSHSAPRRRDTESPPPALPELPIAIVKNQMGEVPAHMRTARVNRVAIPSTLIRSLGDLPTLPRPALDISSDAEFDREPGAQALGEQNRADEGSYTPVLALAADLEKRESPEGGIAKGGIKLDLEDELDFEIERSMWLATTLQNAFSGRNTRSSPDMEAARQPSRTSVAASSALSRSRTSVIFQQITGHFDSSKPPVMSMTSLAPSRDALPPMPSRSDMSLTPMAEAPFRPSIDSRTSRGGTTSTGSSVYMSAGESNRTFRHDSNPEALPPLPSLSTSQFGVRGPHQGNYARSAAGQGVSAIGLPMTKLPSLTSNGSSSVAHVPGAFRPLSLGLGKSSSSKSSLSLGAAIFSEARSSVWHGSNASGSEGSLVDASLTVVPTMGGVATIARSESDNSATLSSVETRPSEDISGSTTAHANTFYSTPPSSTHSASSDSDEENDLNGAVVTQAAKSVAISKIAPSGGPRRVPVPAADPRKPLPLICEDPEPVNLSAKRPSAIIISNSDDARSSLDTRSRTSISAPQPSALPNMVPFMTPYHRAFFPDEPTEASAASSSSVDVNALKVHHSGEASASRSSFSSSISPPASPLLAQLGNEGFLPTSPANEKQSFGSSLVARLKRGRAPSSCPPPQPRESINVAPSISKVMEQQARAQEEARLSSAVVCTPKLSPKPDFSPANSSPYTREEWAVSTSDSPDARAAAVSFMLRPSIESLNRTRAQQRSSFSRHDANVLERAGLGIDELAVSRSSVHSGRTSSTSRARPESEVISTASPIMQPAKWEAEQGITGIQRPLPAISPSELSVSLAAEHPSTGRMSPLATFQSRFSDSLSRRPSLVAATPVSATSPNMSSSALSPRTATNGATWSSSPQQNTTSRQSALLASPRSDYNADTISITSSCVTGGTDAIGEALEDAQHHRARLLQRVQQNAALDRKNASTSLALRNVATSMPPSQSSLSSRKPYHLSVAVSSSALPTNTLVAPLTPPLTPQDPLTTSTSASTMKPSGPPPVPSLPEPAHLHGSRASNSPATDWSSASGGGTKSSKLRPLSLMATASVLDATSFSNFGMPASFPAGVTSASSSSGSLSSQITSMPVAKRTGSRGGVLPVATDAASPSFFSNRSESSPRPPSTFFPRDDPNGPPAFASPTPSSTIGARSPNSSVPPVRSFPDSIQSVTA